MRAERRVLLGAGPAVAAVLHQQVQSDGGRGAAPVVAAGVPQRLLTRRSAQKVSSQRGLRVST